MSDPSYQTIPLEQLTAGMFVVELDIPWMDSPFLTHSRKIKGSKDIQALKQSGVKTVVIDIERGAKPVVGNVQEEGAPASTPGSEAALKTAIKLAPAKQKLAPQSLQAELGAARQVRAQVKRMVGELLESLENEKAINTDEINPLIDETLASLERNNQALMSLVHLSRKSQKLADHAFSTYCLALNIGTLKGVEHTDLQALGLAALLHEAGWVQLPLNLMGKRTRYTTKEIQLIQRHVEMGCKMLQSAKLPALACQIIEQHHERCDGSGYPNRLKQDNIHVLSRILAVADSYDERVHQLQDKPGVLPRNALRELYIEAEKGIFDAEVVAAFVAMMGVYPVSTAVVLNTGEKAVVIENCPRTHNPRVRIFYNEQGKPLAEPVEVELFKNDNEGRRIDKVIDPSNSREDPFDLLVLEAI